MPQDDDERVDWTKADQREWDRGVGELFDILDQKVGRGEITSAEAREFIPRKVREHWETLEQTRRDSEVLQLVDDGILATEVAKTVLSEEAWGDLPES